MLGDQFTIIALPWLMLQLTKDPLALGAVLAAATLPRIFFMPVAGLLADRYDPRRLLQSAKLLSALLLLSLAWAAWNGSASPSGVLVLAFGIGLLNAFGFPCSSAMLPRILNRNQLQAANSAMMALSQVALLGGPLLAGMIISYYGTVGSAGAGAALGLATVFALDAASFLFSAWTLGRVAPAPLEPCNSAVARGERPVGALRSLWDDRSLRRCCMYWIACAMCVYGPVQVCLPLFAQARMDDGAAALGIMLACQGVGAMSGMVFAGVAAQRLGMPVLAFQLLAYALLAVVLVPLGFTHELTTAGALLFVIGFLNGTVQARVFTWIQLRIAPELLGAGTAMFMSMMAVAAAVSGVAAGWLLRLFTPEIFFSAAGAALLGIVALATARTVLVPGHAIESPRA